MDPLGMQIQSLTGWVIWMTYRFMNLSFVFYKGGIILLIHRVAVPMACVPAN
jgi:hypothetical protein